MFLSDEGPTLETLDYTIRIVTTPTFLYLHVYFMICIKFSFDFKITCISKIFSKHGCLDACIQLFTFDNVGFGYFFFQAKGS